MAIKSVQFHNRNHNTVAILKAASGIGDSTVTTPDKTATLITRATVRTMVEDAAKKATSFIMINKPSIITPESETYDYFGDITASEYSTVGTFVGTHTSTDWQFSKTSDFINPEVDVKMDPNNLTVIPFDTLDRDSEYYIRVRYRSNAYLSEWSEPIVLKGTKGYITRPALSLEDTLETTTTPTFTSSEFLPVGTTDNHISTIYEITRTIDFSTVDIRATSTTELYSLTLVSPLDVNTTYYARVKYIGDRFSSSWSPVLVFNTISKTEAPIIAITSTTLENTVVTATIVNYSIDNTYTVGVSIGNVTRNKSIITWELPYLDITTVGLLTVTATDVVLGLNKSNVTEKHVNITNIDIIGDQTLIYDDSNIGTSFETDNLFNTVNNTLVYQTENLIDTDNTSTTSVIYIDNSKYAPKVGDVLVFNNDTIRTVKTVVDDGTTSTATVNGKDITFKAKMYITLTEDLVALPVSVGKEEEVVIPTVITQEAGETDFRGVRTISLKTNSIDLLDPSNVSTTLKLYLDNKLGNVTPGTFLVLDDFKIVEVVTVNNDGATSTYNGKPYFTKYWVTIKTTINTVPTSVKAVPNLMFNGSKTTPVNASDSSGSILVTYRDTEFESVRTLTPVFTLKPGVVVTAINAGIVKVAS